MLVNNKEPVSPKSIHDMFHSLQHKDKNLEISIMLSLRENLTRKIIKV